MNQNYKKVLLEAELAQIENEVIVTDRFKLVLLIESMLSDILKLDAEIDIETTKKESPKASKALSEVSQQILPNAPSSMLVV